MAEGVKPESQTAAEDASLLRAAELVRPIGFVTGPFAACLRHLHNKPADGKAALVNDKGLDASARWLVERFAGAASIRVCFYYLSLTYHAAAVSAKSELSIRDLVSLYSPRDLASVLSLAYLFRSIKTQCPGAEWEPLAKAVQEASDIGGAISQNVHGLELADGILVPAIRYLALGLFLHADSRRAAEYISQVVGSRKGFDCSLEMALWGCTHIQVAAVLLERLGYSRTYISDFKTALSATPEASVTYAVNRLRMIAIMANAMYLGLEQPPVTGEEDFEMSDQSLAALKGRVESVVQNGSPQGWLLKGKDDQAVGRVLGLYKPREEKPAEQEGSVDPSEEADLTAAFKVPYEDLPENVRAQFPRGEMEDLRGMVKDLVRAKK